MRSLRTRIDKLEIGAAIGTGEHHVFQTSTDKLIDADFQSATIKAGTIFDPDITNWPLF